MNATTVVFGLTQTATAWTLGLVCACGTVVNLTLIVLLLAFHNTSRHRAHYSFLVNLVVADMLMCCFNAPIFMRTAVRQDISPHSTDCAIQGVAALTCGAASILFLSALAYERYWTMVKEGPIMSAGHVALICAGVWLFAGFLGGSTLMPQFGHEVTASRVFCTSKWGNDNNVGMIQPILGCATLCSALLFVAGMYRGIYLKIHQLAAARQRQAGQDPPTATATTTRGRHSNNVNTRIAKRMFILVLIFFVNWSLYLAEMLYQATTHQQPSAVFDSVATTLGFTNSLVNPLAYLWLNSTKYVCCTDKRVVPERQPQLQHQQGKLEMMIQLPGLGLSPLQSPRAFAHPYVPYILSYVPRPAQVDLQLEQVDKNNNLSIDPDLSVPQPAKSHQHQLQHPHLIIEPATFPEYTNVHVPSSPSFSSSSASASLSPFAKYGAARKGRRMALAPSPSRSPSRRKQDDAGKQQHHLAAKRSSLLDSAHDAEGSEFRWGRDKTSMTLQVPPRSTLTSNAWP